MTLKKYLKKRDFEKTPEPKSKEIPSKDRLNFCVQKHDASHLHYDFRLEYKGILLSWAVPKGVSMDPADKRLAIMVEDHPLEYRHFEGIIPKGNYGAGTVEIWDEGKYIIPDREDIKSSEKAIQAGLKKGHLEFELFGKKLKGKFDLIQLKNTEKNWLLIKKKDAYSIEGRNNSEEAQEIKKKSKKLAKKSVSMPSFIKPMLATLIKKPFNDAEWLFEIKYDGYRSLAFINSQVVELKSRNNNAFNQMFPIIVNELKKLKTKAILDGEIVVLDDLGRSRFQLIQNYQNKKPQNLVFYVFDILYLDGQDLRNLPLIERKELLKELLLNLESDHIKYSDHIEEKGIDFFNGAKKKSLEGIIGKEKNSPYVSTRSKTWVKIKTHLAQEVVIGGFTEPRGSRQDLGALLLGVYENGEFIYIGHTGGGFTEKLLKEVKQKLLPLVQKKCPFKTTPKANAEVSWVKPKLVCEISFQEWTSDNIVRQAIFQGLRIDKDPKTIVKEIEKPVDEAVTKLKKVSQMNISHPDKIYFPKEKYTKQDLWNYYTQVSKFILPYLKNHPVMLHRFPEGIEGLNFYQKDSSQLHLPTWMKTVMIEHELKPLQYLLIQDLKSLEYIVNLGTIAIHPYLAEVKSLSAPQYLVIDLDPEDISFEHVIKTAQTIHELLEEIKVDSYCKTSGGRGLHIYIPLNSKYDFEQSKQFGEIIAAVVNQMLPTITSLKRSPKDRQKRVYIDVYQNNRSQSVVAPYSVRAKPGAPVSTPLEWDEVVKGLNPSSFTIKTVPERLERKGDLFKNVLKKGCNLEKALKALQKKLQ